MSDFVTDVLLETPSSIGTPSNTDSNLLFEKDELSTNTDITPSESAGEQSGDETDEYTDDDNDDAVMVEENDSQQQWDESMEQLNKVCIFVIFPLLGKFVGKKVANIIWKRIASKIWG